MLNKTSSPSWLKGICRFSQFARSSRGVLKTNERSSRLVSDFQNLTRGHLAPQIICVELRIALDGVRDLARFFTAEFETPSLEFEHVLEPRLGPSTRHHIAAYLFLLRHQRSKAASIAQSENENSLEVDEVIKA